MPNVHLVSTDEGVDSVAKAIKNVLNKIPSKEIQIMWGYPEYFPESSPIKEEEQLEKKSRDDKTPPHQKDGCYNCYYTRCHARVKSGGIPCESWKPIEEAKSYERIKSTPEDKLQFLSCLEKLLNQEFGDEEARIYNKARLLIFSVLAVVEGEGMGPSYDEDWWPIHHDFSNFIDKRKEDKSP